MQYEWSALAAGIAGLLLGALWLRTRASSPRSDSRLPQRAPRTPAQARREPDGWDTAWRHAREPSRAGGAAETLLRVVRDELQRGHREAAIAHWLALCAAGLDTHADPGLAIQLASLLRDGGRDGEAIAALRTALRHSGGATGLAVAVRVARAAADLDPRLALDVAWRALASEELETLDRHDLQGLVAKLQRAATVDVSRQQRSATHAESADGLARPESLPSAGPAVRPEPIDLGACTRRIEVALGVPVAIEPAGLRVVLEGGASRVVTWRELDAVAVGAVEGLGPKPVLVVDLVAGWHRSAEVVLRVVRLRGDRFDPRKLVEGHASPVDALRELVDRLLGETGGVPLPDLRAARGQPFAGFPSLAAFERDVLTADEG